MRSTASATMQAMQASTRTQPRRAELVTGRTQIGPMLLVALVVVGLAGCGGRRYEPSRATRPYPEELGQGSMITVQVFRDAGDLIIVNASPQSFEEVDVWVNHRYMLQIDRLAAGETRRVWFGDFFDQWGETPVALVLLREGESVSEPDLITFCRDKMAHFKCPTQIRFVEELPRTATGKLQKYKLREAFWEGDRLVN